MSEKDNLRHIKNLLEMVADDNATIELQAAQLEQYAKMLDAERAAIAQLRERVDALRAQLAERDATILSLRALRAERDALIAQVTKTLGGYSDSDLLSLATTVAIGYEQWSEGHDAQVAALRAQLDAVPLQEIFRFIYGTQYDTPNDSDADRAVIDAWLRKELSADEP